MIKSIFQRVSLWLHQVFEDGQHDHQRNMITALDGVRAWAIIFVIIFHMSYTTGNNLWDWRTNPLASSLAVAGYSGVSLFFVLSGFLLFLPYAKALLFAGRWPLARSFYVRRALRIWPGYYLSLFALVLLSARQYLQPANLSKLGLFVVFYMDSIRPTFRQLNGPYWTLAVEWQFYMIMPLLMLGILLVVRHIRLEWRLRAVTLCLCGLMAWGLGVRFFGLYFSAHPTATVLVPRSILNIVLFFSFGIIGKYTEEFAVGMLGALIYVYAQSLPPTHPFVQKLHQVSLWLWGTGILLLVFCAMWNFQSNPQTPAWPFLNPLVPYFTWLSDMSLAIAYGMCIMAILFGPYAFQRLFVWKPLRWIGLISYSLYIWHLPLLTFGRYLLPNYAHLNNYAAYAFSWACVLVLAVPFCVFYYAWVERPGMKLGNHWRKALDARYRATHQEQVQEPTVREQQTSDQAKPVASEVIHR